MSQVYEKAILVKIYWSKELHKFLPGIMPGIFEDKTKRLIFYTMKELYERNINITIENIVTAQRSTKIKRFRRKHKIPIYIDTDLVNNLFHDIEVDSSSSLFKEAFEELHDLAFARYVKETNEDFTYELGYRNRQAILARAKSVIRLYELLFKKKLAYNDYRDNIQVVAESINKRDSYLKTSLRCLNNAMGGTSRGFITAVAARPSHGKSTFATQEARHKIKHNLADRVDIISPEEPQEIFWRRIFATELSMSLHRMRNGTIKIPQEGINKVKEMYEGKIFYHELINLRDIIDLIFSIKSPYLLIDHINAIGYPRGDQYNGINTLVNRQKQFLKENPDSVIVNLTQVNTKEMLRKGRLRPRKEDAYNSSVLEQAVREFLVLYYPYKDAVSPETQQYMMGKGEQYRKDRVEVSIDKNSFGDVGIKTIGYDFDHAQFYDIKKSNSRDTLTSGNVILPGEEKQERLL